uniref:Uncharacterized protein n=1 Tax=Neospora caninum (strain Liverpool) TaxID=572307 RepID=A0A0F7UN40_NEOCL|nr:TPA: hypothetical protein BN1204_053415 [Neospora caninum Liverpool]
MAPPACAHLYQGSHLPGRTGKPEELQMGQETFPPLQGSEKETPNGVVLSSRKHPTVAPWSVSPTSSFVTRPQDQYYQHRLSASPASFSCVSPLSLKERGVYLRHQGCNPASVIPASSSPAVDGRSTVYFARGPASSPVTREPVLHGHRSGDITTWCQASVKKTHRQNPLVPKTEEHKASFRHSSHDLKRVEGVVPRIGRNEGEGDSIKAIVPVSSPSSLRAPSTIITDRVCRVFGATELQAVNACSGIADGTAKGDTAPTKTDTEILPSYNMAAGAAAPAGNIIAADERNTVRAKALLSVEQRSEDEFVSPSKSRKRQASLCFNRSPVLLDKRPSSVSEIEFPHAEEETHCGYIQNPIASGVSFEERPDVVSLERRVWETSSLSSVVMNESSWPLSMNRSYEKHNSGPLNSMARRRGHAHSQDGPAASVQSWQRTTCKGCSSSGARPALVSQRLTTGEADHHVPAGTVTVCRGRSTCRLPRSSSFATSSCSVSSHTSGASALSAIRKAYAAIKSARASSPSNGGPSAPSFCNHGEMEKSQRTTSSSLSPTICGRARPPGEKEAFYPHRLSGGKTRFSVEKTSSYPYSRSCQTELSYRHDSASDAHCLTPFQAELRLQQRISSERRKPNVYLSLLKMLEVSSTNFSNLQQKEECHMKGHRRRPNVFYEADGGNANRTCVEGGTSDSHLVCRTCGNERDHETGKSPSFPVETPGHASRRLRPSASQPSAPQGEAAQNCETGETDTYPSFVTGSSHRGEGKTDAAERPMSISNVAVVGDPQQSTGRPGLNLIERADFRQLGDAAAQPRAAFETMKTAYQLIHQDPDEQISTPPADSPCLACLKRAIEGDYNSEAAGAGFSEDDHFCTARESLNTYSVRLLEGRQALSLEDGKKEWEMDVHAQRKTGSEKKGHEHCEAPRAVESVLDLVPSETLADHTGNGDTVVSSAERHGSCALLGASGTVKRGVDGQRLPPPGREGETMGDETRVDEVKPGNDSAADDEIRGDREANVHFFQNEVGHRTVVAAREEIVRVSQSHEGGKNDRVMGPKDGADRDAEKREESNERSRCYARMLMSLRQNGHRAEGSVKSKLAQADGAPAPLVSMYPRNQNRNRTTDAGCDAESNKLLARRVSRNIQETCVAGIPQCRCIPCRPQSSSASCLKERSEPSGLPLSQPSIPAPLDSPSCSSSFFPSTKAVRAVRDEGTKVSDAFSVFTEGSISESSRASSSATASTRASTCSAFRISSVRGASADVASGARTSRFWNESGDMSVSTKTEVIRTSGKGADGGSKHLTCVGRSDTASLLSGTPARTCFTSGAAGSCEKFPGRHSEGELESVDFLQGFGRTRGNVTIPTACSDTETVVATARIHMKEAPGRLSCGKREERSKVVGFTALSESGGEGSRHYGRVNQAVDVHACAVTKGSGNGARQSLENTPHSTVQQASANAGYRGPPVGIAPIVSLKTSKAAKPNDYNVDDEEETVNVTANDRRGDDAEAPLAGRCLRDPSTPPVECQGIYNHERHSGTESEERSISHDLICNLLARAQKLIITDGVPTVLSDQRSDASLQAVKGADSLPRASFRMQQMQPEQVQSLADQGATSDVSRGSSSSPTKEETSLLSGCRCHTHRPISTRNTPDLSPLSTMSSSATRLSPYGERPTVTQSCDKNPIVDGSWDTISPSGPTTSKGAPGRETVSRDAHSLDRTRSQNEGKRFTRTSHGGKTKMWSPQTKTKQIRRGRLGSHLVWNIAETDRSRVNGESPTPPRGVAVRREGKLFRSYTRGTLDECHGNRLRVEDEETQRARGAHQLNGVSTKTKHGTEGSSGGLPAYSRKRPPSPELIGVYIPDPDDDDLETILSTENDAEHPTSQLVPGVAFTAKPITSVRESRKENTRRGAAEPLSDSFGNATNSEVTLPPIPSYAKAPGVNAVADSSPSLPNSILCATSAVRTSPSKSTKYPSLFRQQHYDPGDKTDHGGGGAKSAYVCVANEVPCSTRMVGNSRLFTWLFPTPSAELGVRPTSYGDGDRDIPTGERHHTQEVRNSILYGGEGVLEQGRADEKMRWANGKECTRVIPESWEERIAATRRSVREQMGHLLQEDQIRWKVETCMAGVFDRLSAKCKCCCGGTWQKMSVERKQRCGQITFWTLAGTLVVLIFIAVICLVSAKVLNDTE